MKRDSADDAMDEQQQKDDDEMELDTTRGDHVGELLTLEIPTRSTVASMDSSSSSLEPKTTASSSSIEPPTPLMTSPSQHKRKPSDSQRRRRSSLLGASSSSSSSTNGDSSSARSSGSFPTPFKCCGDFCDFIIQQPLQGNSSSNSSSTMSNSKSPIKPLIARFDSSKAVEAATALQLLFSSEERQIIGDQKLQQLLESVHVARWDDPHAHGRSAKATTSSLPADSSSSSFDQKDLRVITFKSVALARPNKQHLTASLQSTTAITTATILSEGHDKAKKDPHRKRSSLMDPTLAHAIRESCRTRVYGEMEGVANHYRQVRVCPNCYAIYTLLDRARELAVHQGDGGLQSAMDKQSANKRAVVKAKWGAMVDERVSDKEKLFLRHNGNSNSNTTSSLGSSASAPVLSLPLSSSTGSGTLPAIYSPKGTHPEKDDSTSASAATVLKSTTGTLPSVGSSYLATNSNKEMPRHAVKGKDSVVSMDKYLRGESKQIEEKVLHEGKLFQVGELDKTSGRRRAPASRGAGRRPISEPLPSARVLLVDSDLNVLQFLHDTLAHAATTPALPFSIEMESLTDPREALRAVKETGGFDLILVERDLHPPGSSQGAPSSSTGSATTTAALSGLEFTKLVRQHELQRSVSSSSSSSSGKPRRTPILCLTSKTTASDLQLYKDAGMDGCIGKPLKNESLLQTVHAALTKALAAAASSSSSNNTAISTATDAIARAKLDQQERATRKRRKREAASTFHFPRLLETDVRDYTHGTFQMDSETSFPYCILGDKTSNSITTGQKNTFFNLVVIHDLFDTWERLQILLNPIVTKYQGAIQILVWNYPGQAYTTWRTGTVLNNTYHCQCFQSLLNYVGPQGQGFLRDAPYHLLGLGNGGNIATMFCSQSPPFDRNTRALVLANSFCHVDAQLAQFLHDSLKVFACTPESRPDLPVYFHTRFLFSSQYLAKVTAPLALNLYTAVMNPLTLDGRKALCQGALNHKDLRSEALKLTVPFVSICGSHDALVNGATQTQSLVDATRVVLVDSIGKVLSNKQKKLLSTVVWLASGHELLQECKSEMLLLLEQLVTGFHEQQDTPHGNSDIAGRSVCLTHPGSPKKQQPATAVSVVAAPRRDEDEDPKKTKPGVVRKPTAAAGAASSYEDRFIDRVLTTVNQVVPSPITSGGSSPGTSTNQLTSPDKKHHHPQQQQLQQKDPAWLAFQSETTASSHNHSTTIATTQEPTAVARRSKTKQKPSGSTSHFTSWDPTTPAFERLSTNLIYKIGDGSKIYPDPSSTTNKTMPEVKEYMAWRVQRNHKRLQRMENKVRIIQKAYRAFFARTLAWRLKREKCAIVLQRIWRAKSARKKYHGMQKKDWAVRLVQRQWRGKMGRNNYKEKFQKYLAAQEIQRIVRGKLARKFVLQVKTKMHTSATNIQRLIRRYLATRKMFRLRKRKNAVILIQKVFRGHLGRKRFAHEKEKYLFSKTQTQGITFGKQMLLEYKLYGTKLQSEVAVLTSTKQHVEKEAEQIVNEICEFEEGIRVLEMEMHQLSQLETEGLSKQMDEQAKWQLREQKMRLDREFTQMLTQIATRKEQLAAMEDKLHQLDSERLTKEDQLKMLERKLVVLLEDQQKELDKIKHKQQTRSQLLLDLVPSSSSSGGPGSAMAGSPFSSSGSSSFSGFSGSQGGSGGGDGRSSSSSSSKSTLIQSAAVNSASAFSTQQREEANSLMESTETMMKFGFMSMSMTYFSSMNMVRAMRKIGAQHLTLDSAAAVSNHKWPEYGGGATGGGATGGGASGTGFQPAVPAGSFPGQQPLQVAGWSVTDVGKWLDTLALAQYKRAFQDAAVDGALLLHLNEEDLKNTLGMEHRLHRKKIVTSVDQLRESERIKMKKLYGASNPDDMPTGGSSSTFSGSSSGAPSPMVAASSAAPSPARSLAMATTSQPASDATGGSAGGGPGGSKMLVSFGDFCTHVRHGKLKQVKEALASFPDRKFDALCVATQNAPGMGTLYDDVLEKSVFHINKGDENGNTPLLLAAQNNSLKVVQYLVSKGANPNHQNKHGQTAGHYAMAYSFFDLGAWLLDPEKGGGRDDIANENGLTAYDGL